MAFSTPQRCPSRAGFISAEIFADCDTDSIASISSSDSNLLPTIHEKSCNEMSPPPKRNPTEDFDDVWFRCHLAEVIELDIFDKGCPYFRRLGPGIGQYPQTALGDIAYYVNTDDDKESRK